MAERSIWQSARELFDPTYVPPAEAAPFSKFLDMLTKQVGTRNIAEQLLKEMPRAEKEALEALHNLPPVSRAPLFGGDLVGGSHWNPPDPHLLAQTRVSTPRTWASESYPDIPYEKIMQTQEVARRLGSTIWNQEPGINPIHVYVHETGGHAMPGPLDIFRAQRAGESVPFNNPFSIFTHPSALMEGFAEHFANTLVPSTGGRLHYTRQFRGKPHLLGTFRDASSLGKQAARDLSTSKTLNTESIIDSLLNILDRAYAWKKEYLR